MRWLLVFASMTAAGVWARPSQQLSGDAEAQQPSRQNMARLVSRENVNRTLGDSVRRSSQSRSRQTANCSSEWTPGDAWKPTSREAPSAPSVTLNLTSEDTAAFHRLSMPESDPVVVGLGFSSKGCSLPTCSIADLGSKLQIGEETAGASTLVADGFGKK